MVKPKRKPVKKQKSVKRTKNKLKLKRLKTSETANTVVNYCHKTIKIETVADKNFAIYTIN